MTEPPRPEEAQHILQELISNGLVEPPRPGLREPLPCPFCDEKPGDSAFWFAVRDVPPDAHVFCLKCNCEGPHRETLDEAVEAWNARAPALTEPQARATADAERLEEAVRLLEPFGRLSDRLPDEGVLVEVCRPHPDNPSRRIEPFLTQHLRAAAAFLLTLTQD